MEIALSPIMAKRQPRQPYESETYKEMWLFGAEARAWVESHKASGFHSRVGAHVDAYRAETRIGDGWGIVVSFDKRRPDDQSCRRVICPKCKNEMRLNQSSWAMKHERKCGLPTRSAIACAFGEAFNVFSTDGTKSLYEIHLEQKAAREAAKETK